MLYNSCEEPSQLKKKSISSSKTTSKKRIVIHSSTHAEEIKLKIRHLSALQIKHLAPIRYVTEEENVIEVYFQPSEHALEEVIMEHNAQIIKVLHKQFIELAIGLARTGIVTSFDGQNCRIVTQHQKYVLRYQLGPEELILSDNLQCIEEAVLLFSAQALQYMKNIAVRNPLQTMTCLSSQEQIRASMSKKQIPEVPESKRLKISKHSINSTQETNTQSKANQNSLRKLSILSKELSEISARHEAIKISTSSTAHFLQHHGRHSLLINQQKQGLSDQSILSFSGTLVPNPQSNLSMIVNRSKRAQQQLLGIREKLIPYKQLLDILRGIRG